MPLHARQVGSREVSDIDPALLARIEAAQTTKDLFLIGNELLDKNALTTEIVNLIIARRNAIIGHKPPHA
jgi:hypothetical protein